MDSHVALVSDLGTVKRFDKHSWRQKDDLEVGHLFAIFGVHIQFVVLEDKEDLAVVAVWLPDQPIALVVVEFIHERQLEAIEDDVLDLVLRLKGWR